MSGHSNNYMRYIASHMQYFTMGFILILGAIFYGIFANLTVDPNDSNCIEMDPRYSSVYKSRTFSNKISYTIALVIPASLAFIYAILDRQLKKQKHKLTTFMIVLFGLGNAFFWTLGLGYFISYYAPTLPPNFFARCKYAGYNGYDWPTTATSSPIATVPMFGMRCNFAQCIDKFYTNDVTSWPNSVTMIMAVGMIYTSFIMKSSFRIHQEYHISFFNALSDLPLLFVAYTVGTEVDEGYAAPVDVLSAVFIAYIICSVVIENVRYVLKCFNTSYVNQEPAPNELVIAMPTNMNVINI